MKAFGLLVYAMTVGMGLQAIVQIIWRRGSSRIAYLRPVSARRDLVKCLLILIAIALPPVFLIFI